MKKIGYIYLLRAILFILPPGVIAQDVIHLKNGTSIDCRITEITDFILYAEIKEGPEKLTFFSDDVSHLVIGQRNEAMIWKLKEGVRDARELTDFSQDSSANEFYFGFTYDSISNYNKSKKNYHTDSLGKPILVPYNPLKTPFSIRVKSLIKSFGGGKDDAGDR